MLVLVLAIAVADLSWLPFSSVNPNKALWIETVIANAPWALLCVILGAMRLQLRKTPFRYRNILSEVAARLQALIMAYVFITMFSVGLLLITYLATATSRPLLDSYLAAGDAALGFSWVGYVRLLNGHPTIAHALSVAYGSLTMQLFVLPAILVLTKRSARLEEFTAYFGVAGCLTCLIMIAVPAAGAFDFYHPAPDLLSSFGPGASTRHLEQVHKLRTLEPFLIKDPEGLVTFPSFHTALAAIFAYSMRGVRYLAPPICVLNAMLILATFPQGSHYLVDVLAGLAVAAVSIKSVNWIARIRMPQQAYSSARHITGVGGGWK